MEGRLFKINSVNKISKHVFLIRYVVVLGLLLFLSSCFFSTKYHAAYTIKDKTSASNTKDISVNLINKLAENNNLVKDSKFIGTDTLGYFGNPYHYFKFWFEQVDNQTKVKLYYYGVFGSRRKPPYRNLLRNIEDSIKMNFDVVEQDVKETTNFKEKK